VTSPAADVLQTLHVLLHRGGLVPGYVDPPTLLACYVAAIVHDYEHRWVLVWKPIGPLFCMYANLFYDSYHVCGTLASHMCMLSSTHHGFKVHHIVSTTVLLPPSFF
jgi:hypothetical protein